MIEPWLAFLRHRQDSYAFHDLTVIESVEAVFGPYAKGVVVPAWRWELADQSIYRKRSLTSQYQESDFAFVTRLLAEKGIFYWFEHAGDASSATLGAHTLVLADSNTAFHADAAWAVRFHRSNATEREDSIQRWEPECRWQAGRVARASWDYRTLSLRPAGAEVVGPAVPASDADTSGPYAWVDAAQGQYRARQHLDALHVASRVVEGAGSVRCIAPGQCFVLTQHPTQGAEPLVCLKLHHRARNNFNAEMESAIEQSLGRAFEPPVAAGFAGHSRAGGAPASWGFGHSSHWVPAFAGTTDRVAGFAPGNGWDAGALQGGDGAFDPLPFKGRATGGGGLARSAGASDSDFYSNTFTALPIARRYRPHTAAGHGLRRQPRATVTGSQIAIVAGNGDPVHTDRDHRVIVQQHWQRGQNAASRLGHPRKAGAPANASSGTWARVTTPMSGANWGSVMLPRVGQEVWLQYLEGDVDRPVVLAGLYNGQGNQDAPHNQRAGGPSNATGNAAAWFTGNQHAGVLSGIKNQDLATSAIGSGGYRQLQFDDTPGQGHAQLATTDYATALTLGHLKHLEDNARKTDLGYGADLATQAQGALRGGAGLLVTSASGADPMDASQAIGVLDSNTQFTRESPKSRASSKRPCRMSPKPQSSTPSPNRSNSPGNSPRPTKVTPRATASAAVKVARPAGPGRTSSSTVRTG